MATTTYPRNVVPFPRQGTLAVEPQGERPRPALALLDRHELLDRLAEMGDIAPTSPLSFLLVHLRERQSAGSTRLLTRHVLDTLGTRAGSLLRPVDAIGRWGRASLGVALQGAGSRTAAATAARLSLHLNSLLQSARLDFEVRVFAASGFGASALALPIAASEEVEDID